MATDKQQRAVEIFVANRGKSKAQAMREAGYAEKTARNPKNLTSSPAWEELLDKALPDKKLVAGHKKLLNAQKIEHMVFPLGMEEEDIRTLLRSVGSRPKKIKYGEQAIHVWYWAPDLRAQASAIELGYKIKGKLTTKIEHSGEVDGLFGADALTIKVVDGRADPEQEAAPGV